MSNCCASSHENRQMPGEACPGCGEKGRAVETLTLKALLRPDALARLLPRDHFFCRTRTCPVVYFANDAESVYRKEDLKVRVGLKEEDDPIPVCYCFGHTRASIRDEIDRTGGTTVVEAISEHIRAGRCACEVNNPGGACCLGDVRKVVKDLLGRDAGKSGASAAPDAGGCCCGTGDQ